MQLPPLPSSPTSKPPSPFQWKELLLALTVNCDPATVYCEDQLIPILNTMYSKKILTSNTLNFKVAMLKVAMLKVAMLKVAVLKVAMLNVKSCI
ncbi:hypothetical protein DHC50_18630 [Arenibacter sp. A80]|nr:hypothetical protein [Arenibacter sp. A80]RFT54769.1 hypothetical protein D0S24_18625 [Arenibacter sp. P308M17]